MSEPIKMPALGESVTEGTVTQWLKEVGDTIEVDEPLLEVSTDKVDTEVPSPVAGVIEKIVVEEDETVEVGAVLAYVGDGSGSSEPADDEPKAEEAPAEEAPAEEAPAEEAPKAASSGSGETVAMPALGESVTEGTVTQWLKEVGDTVEVDEPLLEVSTDKVDTEVPSPVAGTIIEILVGEDETVEVGAPLVVIGDPNAAPAASEAPKAEEKAEAPAEEKEEEAPQAEEAPKPPSQSLSSAGGEKVTMPALGESVTEGTVTQWLKEVGDTVEVDEPLLEVSTDKVDTEVPSPVAGTIIEILVGEDETVEVGAPLAIIGDPNAAPAASEAPKVEEKAEAPAAPAPAAPAPATPAEEEPHKADASTDEKTEEKAEAPKAEAPKAEAPKASVAETASKGYVTPIVRKLAKKLDVDLSTVKGTGVGGRIRREDVEKAAESKSAAPAAAAAPAAPAKSARVIEESPLRGKTEKMTRLRQVISKRMLESMQTSAQLTTVVEVDVTNIVALRAKAKESFQAAEGTKLTYLPFFVKAATEALKGHPKINASIVDENQVKYYDYENVGIAVDTERGLMVPVIKNAGDLNIAGISKQINDLAARTRDGKVSPDELSGGTFTITNTGSAGALFDTPILNMPESAILGVGTIYKRPAVVKAADGSETIGIRSFVYLALSYDHRLVDGADAGRYLSAVRARLEEGDFGSEVGL